MKKIDYFSIFVLKIMINNVDIYQLLYMGNVLEMLVECNICELQKLEMI